ncbi:MAG TPA: hypothetical protein VGW36_00875, partial [Pyrinomonadaceae bacterium]|nr:hypothetical protein [Pyrinomonadaceae bacterium]
LSECAKAPKARYVIAWANGPRDRIGRPFKPQRGEISPTVAVQDRDNVAPSELWFVVGILPRALPEAISSRAFGATGVRVTSSASAVKMRQFPARLNPPLP